MTSSSVRSSRHVLPRSAWSTRRPKPHPLYADAKLRIIRKRLSRVAASISCVDVLCNGAEGSSLCRFAAVTSRRPAFFPSFRCARSAINSAILSRRSAFSTLSLHWLTNFARKAQHVAVGGPLYSLAHDLFQGERKQLGILGRLDFEGRHAGAYNGACGQPDGVENGLAGQSLGVRSGEMDADASVLCTDRAWIYPNQWS